MKLYLQLYWLIDWLVDTVIMNKMLNIYIRLYRTKKLARKGSHVMKFIRKPGDPKEL